MTIHAGFLGGGNISGTHLRAAQQIEGLEISAIWGQNAEKVKALGEECDAPAFTELEPFLQCRPMDMVVIGSPSGLHAAHGIAVARQGLHVLVEKPLDVSTANADRLIAECEAAAVKLGVCFQDRVAPDILRLKELLESGRLGKPLLVSAHVRWHRPPEYYGDSKWRGTWQLDGGGALINQGVHTVDLLLWLLGGVRRVYARAATLLHRIETEDTAVATLEFTNGTLGILEAATSAYPGYPRRIVLSGSEGTLILEEDQLVGVDLRGAVGDENLPAQAEGGRKPEAGVAAVADVTGHRRIIEDFIGAIQGDRSPICDGLEARKSVALVEALYQSSRTDQPVTLGGGGS